MAPAFSLLTELDAAARAEMIAAATLVDYRAGSVIFHQGDAASSCYVVQRGRVVLRQLNQAGEQVIHRLVGDDAMFGGVAAWSGSTYPVSAAAGLDTRVYRWPGPVLFELMARRPALLLAALQYVSRRLIDSQNRLCELATLTMSQRLARRLLALSEGPTAAVSIAIEGLTRQELAEMCGTTLYSVSRQLRTWQAQGWLTCGRRAIHIRDRAALQAEAGPTSF